MQPLSPRVRARYFYTFIALFIGLLPLVIMYADGWRWSGELGFYKAGGIFVAVPYQDADVFINGESIGRSSFFDRSFYISNLEPASYVVEVRHEGYLSWNRVLVVEPQIVTDADALLIPKRIEFERLMVSGTATTGIAVISRTQYDSYITAFATTSISASTTLPQDQSDGIGLFVEKGDIIARWISDSAFPPSRFCGEPSFCAEEIAVEQSGETARTARFFYGGVIYATREGGVYFSEMDVRPAPASVKIFDTPGSDIRVIGDALIIKDGGALYRVNL